MTLWVAHRIDLADDFDQLSPNLVILFAIQEYLSLALLLRFGCLKLFFDRNCVGNEPPSISLDQHQLEDVELLECNPILVELLEVDLNVRPDLLQGDVGVVIARKRVDILDHMLNVAEAVEQLLPCLQNVL